MAIEVRWGAATHQGLVRETNQDALLAGPTVFAVADGMAIRQTLELIEPALRRFPAKDRLFT